MKTDFTVIQLSTILKLYSDQSGQFIQKFITKKMLRWILFEAIDTQEAL